METGGFDISLHKQLQVHFSSKMFGESLEPSMFINIHSILMVIDVLETWEPQLSKTSNIIRIQRIAFENDQSENFEKVKKDE